MNAGERTRQLLQRARRWQALGLLAMVLPPLAALVWLAWVELGQTSAQWTAVLGMGMLVALTAQRQRALGATWLVQRLDQALPQLEDSSDLLLREPGSLPALAQLQRQRIAARLLAQPSLDLRPTWPRRTLLACWLLAALIAGCAWYLQRPLPATLALAENAPAPVSRTHTELQQFKLQITPPEYTGLPVRIETSLSARIPAGSRLDWSMQFDPAPRTASLAFHDDSKLALIPGPQFSASRSPERGLLYRIELDAAALPLADQTLQRIELIPDLAPEIKVILPERSLSLIEPGQRRWRVEFEASDDYGLGPARLELTLAQGSGENQSVRRQSIQLRGSGDDPRLRRYAHELDLVALGMAAGDDLIVRLELTDNRAPKPQRGRSGSLILRWPAKEMGESTGMDGLVQKVLPAYFRSQRQIIIDTEGLLAQAPKLDQDTLVARADAIGVDQRLLRLRYGQFLGEESETVAAPPETGEHAGEDEQHHPDDGHDHGAETATASTGFGALEGSALEAFGHTHDIAEAATLLDPETRELLRAALNEMWQAELHLRTGEPRQALPYEYRALDYIKRVQQASRIYLARVGLELPPIDPARRLTGDRSGVRARIDPLTAPTREPDPVSAVWHALNQSQTPDLQPLAQWVYAREQSLPEALTLLASIDALQRDPACTECRAALARQLWPLLPVPEANAGLRVQPDAAGNAYLDALREPELAP